MKSWGERGSGPGQFNLPHAIVVDRNNQIYVGDRSNRRIQVFDTEGKFIRMFTIDVALATQGRGRSTASTPMPGHAWRRSSALPNSICITPGPNQVLFVGESTCPGRLFKVSLEGKVLGVIGKFRTPVGPILGRSPTGVPTSENEVYAAETSNWRVQKPIASSATRHRHGAALTSATNRRP